MKKHIVICDRCGEEENMIINLAACYGSPDNWSAPKFNLDFCPDCTREYEKSIDKFMKNKEEK